MEAITGDLFTARYADCIFNEDHFLALGGRDFRLIQNDMK
jgi:hypothetical protein